MIRGSLVSLLVSVLLMIVKQTSSALIEVSPSAPQPQTNSAIYQADINPWAVKFDQQGAGRINATTITAGTSAVLLHKQTPADITSGPNTTAVVLKDCQVLNGTQDLCLCGSATVNGADMTASTYGTATKLTNNLIIWKAYCTTQGPANCLNSAIASGNLASACYVAPTPGASTLAPGAGGSSTAGGPVVTSIVNATKGSGASMTTSQVTVLTIGPLAMLAVANFVV